MNGKNILKVSGLIIGSIIGAGFMTGREIIEFFSSYGLHAYYSSIIACSLFFLMITFILIYCNNKNINNFPDFVSTIMGKKSIKFINLIIYSFCFVIYCIMISASGALFYQFFSFSYWYGILFISIACFLSFIYNIEGISNVNTIIIPLLVIGLIIICITYLKNTPLQNSYIKQSLWQSILSAVIYFGYNSLLIIVALPFSAKYIQSNSLAVLSAILICSSMFILLYFLISVTLSFPESIKNLEMPMLEISSISGKIFKYFYIILMQIAIYTTALTSGYACIFKISRSLRINKMIVCAVFCTACIPISFIKFSILIKYMYHLFGIIGIGITALFFVNSFLHKKK